MQVLEQHRHISGVHLNLDEPSIQRQSDSSFSEERTLSHSRNSSVSEEKGRKRTKSEEVNVENNDNNNISDESDKNMNTAEDDVIDDHNDGDDVIDGEIVPSHKENSKSFSSGNINNQKVRSKSESENSDTKSKSESDAHDSEEKSQKAVIAVDEKRLLQEEFNKLRSFAQEVVPKPLYEEVSFVEEVEEEPIVENMERVEVDHEESQEEFQSRFFTYDKVHENENSYHLPDFSDLDYEYHDFGVNEIDPDLLSMNLAPIIEETEEELEEDKEYVVEEEEQDWRGNWMFKGIYYFSLCLCLVCLVLLAAGLDLGSEI